jgi:hypothetical protein
MREGETIQIRIDQLFLATIDLVIANSRNISRVSTEQLITSAGATFRVGF